MSLVKFETEDLQITYLQKNKNAEGNIVEIKINCNALVRYLFFIEIVLICLSLLGYYFREYHEGVLNKIGYLMHEFYLGTESNIPTYFSTLLLLLAGLLFGIIAIYKKKQKDPLFLYWLVLAAVFSFLSVDENISLHELLANGFKNRLNLNDFFTYTWVIIAIPVILLFGLAYTKFFFSHNLFYKLRFLASAVCYIGGAVGMEMIGGYIATNLTQSHFAYVTSMHIEESLEMLGVIILIYTLFKYIKQNVCVRFLI